MNTKEFEYVLTILQEGSITKAANRLFIAQPSLSQYLTSLEERYENKIFDRSTTPWTLTYFGEVYVRTAREVLQLNRDLLQVSQDTRDFRAGRLRVGIPFTRAAALAPELLPLFHEAYPHITIDLHEETSRVLEMQLKNGEIDLLICYGDSNGEDSALAREVIAQEHLWFVIPKKYTDLPEEGIKTLPFLELYQRIPEEKQHFILLHENQRIRNAAERIFKEYGIQPKVTEYSRQLSTVARLCSAGMGLTFVTSMVKDAVEADSRYKGMVWYYPMGSKHDTPIVAEYRWNSIPVIGNIFIDYARHILQGKTITGTS